MFFQANLITTGWLMSYGTFTRLKEIPEKCWRGSQFKAKISKKVEFVRNK